MKQINWNNVQEQEQGKGYTQLPAGAYECTIMEVTDDAQRESLTVSVEISAGEYAGYYTNRAGSNGEIRYGKMFVRYGNDQYNSAGKFKAFVTALEHGNRGFRWDGINEHAFVGKKIGVVFSEREFLGRNGDVLTGVNAAYPISLQRLDSGDYTIPRKRTLNASAAPADAGFTPVATEPLPF